METASISRDESSAIELGGRETVKGPGAPWFKKLSAQVFLRSLVHLRDAAWSLVRRREPRRHTRAERSVLLTGTFYSENWIMNHLRPLAASERCSRVLLVCTFPIPPTRNVEVIPPCAWLRRMIGSTPARLLTFFWTGWRRSPDVVGGFHLLVNGLLAPVLARMIRARSIYFCGGGPREVVQGGYLSANSLFRLLRAPDYVLERRLLRAIGDVDLVVTMGNRTIDYFHERGVTTWFEALPGGIDATAYGTGDTQKDFDLILVGRLVPVKAIPLFLATVRHLAGEFPNISAAIVGEGELASTLKALAKELKIEGNVTFAGFQKDVTSWLSRSKIFVLTSESEGLSLALMEAMIVGLPSVVSDVGELGELVEDGVNGYLVQDRTPEKFAQRLAPMLSNDVGRSTMGQSARRAALKFDLREASKRWDAILPRL